MSQKSERRQARHAVAGYHGVKLAELVAHVAEATDRFRSGELDAFDVDEVLFQYSRAAKELWKFCNMGDVELTARQVHEDRRSTGGNAGRQHALGLRPMKNHPASLADGDAAEHASYRRQTA